MGTSTPKNSNTNNPGISKPVSFGTITPQVAAITPTNQIRGVSANASTGPGIPQQVTNVSATVSNASKGTTSAVTVTFRRSSTDTAFSGVNVYAKGYQSNGSYVQVGGGSDSPVTFVLNNTGEAVSLLVQARGNAGVAPINSSPTTGIKLPTGTSGGFGTTTVTNTITTAQTTVINGSFYSGAVTWGQLAGATTSISWNQGVANQVICYQMILDVEYTVNNVTVAVNGVGTGTAAVGVYSQDGNTKLIDTGAGTITAPGAGTIQTVALGSTVTLNPGVYWFASSATQTTSQSSLGISFTTGAVGGITLLNKKNVKVGIAANAMSGGALPSTLGTITAATSSSFPTALFEV